ncbi:MAG: bacillithiol biosynthesis BshC [Gemmatimonadaceae bacterium]
MTDVRILSEPLGGTPLSLLLQRGEAPSDWLRGTPVGRDGWRELAAERTGMRDWDSTWSALEPALAASGPAADRLARVRREGGIVVTTGQQPGLFGGPIYTWTKAMGALALADAIERATGIATAAIFWAATDDADFFEASYTVVARAGGADRLVQQDVPEAGTPMALAPLGDVGAQLALLTSACGSAADPRPLEAVSRAYGDPRRTVGDAYVSLLRTLLAPLGVPVLDASHPAVFAASRPVLQDALDDAADIERALLDRTAEIRATGFEPQVEDMPGLALVFARDGARKRRLAANERVADNLVLTPNVLLRPIVEHAILPTVAYWAGPGELAYFAQVTAAAAAMGRPVPLAVPRWSCTLLEPHVKTVLHRLGLQPDDLRLPYVAERRLAREAMDPRTAAGIAGLRADLAALGDRLGPEPRELGLDAVVQGAIGSLQHRVDRLERRLLAGVARRESARMRDLGTARGALYPFGGRQERTLNLVPTLARHGLDLLGELRDAAAGHAEMIVQGATVGATPAPIVA